MRWLHRREQQVEILVGIGQDMVVNSRAQCGAGDSARTGRADRVDRWSLEDRACLADRVDHGCPDIPADRRDLSRIQCIVLIYGITTVL